jgi:hypothetical protein
MELVVWIVFAASATFSIAAIVVAGLRGLQTWRTFQTVSTSLGGALEDFVKRAEATGKHAAGAAERTARLTEAVSRLQRSLAVLAVLDSAAGESRAVIAGLRGLVPRK